MNISSRLKGHTTPTPEFRDILKEMNSLRREVTRFGQTHKNQNEYNHLLKRFDALEKTVRRHYGQLNNLEQAVITAANTKLTEKQQIILRWLINHNENETVYTVLIQQLSEEFDIPESTVRWNLKGLREAELINAGDRYNKGVPVSLTETGRIMAGCALMGD